MPIKETVIIKTTLGASLLGALSSLIYNGKDLVLALILGITTGILSYLYEYFHIDNDDKKHASVGRIITDAWSVFQHSII